MSSRCPKITVLMVWVDKSTREMINLWGFHLNNDFDISIERKERGGMGRNFKVIWNSGYLQRSKRMFAKWKKLGPSSRGILILSMGQRHTWSLSAVKFIFAGKLKGPAPQLSGVFHPAGNQILCNAVSSWYKCLQNPLEPLCWVGTHSSGFTASQGTAGWVFPVLSH